MYRDPPGSPAASKHRINDLDLVVIAPDATTYYGNVGLESGNYSVPGGPHQAAHG